MISLHSRSFCRAAILVVALFILSNLASAEEEPTTIFLPSVWFAEISFPNTTRVSVASDGREGNQLSWNPSISADGRFVAFWSAASNLVSFDTNGVIDIFVHDTQSKETKRVSTSSDGLQANGESWAPSISEDGRFVAFESAANNLVGEDTNNIGDIFVHDLQSGETTRVSVSTDGHQANGYSTYPSISSDGRFVAFSSFASNLVSGDTNEDCSVNCPDIFVHDLQTGQTSIISVASDGTQSNKESWKPAISADGRFVTFVSWASNLVSGDTNGRGDIFVHDMQTRITSRVSVGSGGTETNGESWSPSISADGRLVAFESLASNLVYADSNTYGDIFIHDRQTGETRRVSVDSEGNQGNFYSWYPAISADGNFVVFVSEASNLVDGDENGWVDIFIYNLQTLETSLVSISSENGQGNEESWFPSLSEDGRFVAFASYASNLVIGDTNSYCSGHNITLNCADIFLRDRGTVDGQ